MKIRRGTAADAAARFQSTFSARMSRLSPRVRAALTRTATGRAAIDTWHIAQAGAAGIVSADERAVRWAESVRIAAALLDLVLAGELVIVVPPGRGEPEFMSRSRTGKDPRR